ncbi:TetR/AcrR family transcriptional regulator [Nonomuraea longispora]|uniref:TetR/AcrR family transcriptional regulator n=1 Tax=Nonomuraea longispora TaxID=1848320 RepID=A0A4R4NLH7_9ACTN|nr:TetR/AcrR family transcriptional regulator [Nonomuraea longispora]TDC08417.1 TetR/AcrR family transcriptional regulator [Nonomuraea longispora]
MPRDTLTKEQIVRAAIEVLDAEGVHGLNMRRLGAQLGCAATAVYHHVRSKDKLVVLAADHVFGEIALRARAGAAMDAATTQPADAAFHFGLHALLDGLQARLAPGSTSDHALASGHPGATKGDTA